MNRTNQTVNTSFTILVGSLDVRKMTVCERTKDSFIFFFAFFAAGTLDLGPIIHPCRRHRHPTVLDFLIYTITFALCSHVLVAISSFVGSFRRCLQGSLLSRILPLFGKAQPRGIGRASEFEWQECVGPSRSQRSPGQGAWRILVAD
jgi:hypothetical protein